MRYHFHVCTVGEMVKDRDGRELDDVAAAKAFATRYARLLQSKPAYCGIAFRVIEIRTGAGQLIASVPFANDRMPARATSVHGLAPRSDGRRALRSTNGRIDSVEPRS